jgi:DnaK suppressor protein
MQAYLLEKARTRLTERRTRLQSELERLDEERIELTRPVGELSNLPTHNADRADEGLEVQIAVQDTLTDELEQIDVALQHIQDGSYGICETCGHEIAAERLSALPFATHCIVCARGED